MSSTNLFMIAYDKWSRWVVFYSRDWKRRKQIASANYHWFYSAVC